MKRWLRRGLLGLAVLVLVWWTGVPQEMAIEWAAETYGGVVIEIDGGHYLSGIGFDWVNIYPDRAAKIRDEEIILLENIRIGAGDKSGRYIGLVQLTSMSFSLLEDEEQGWNYQFVLDLLNGEESVLDDIWIPESIEIGRIHIGSDGIDYDLLLFAFSMEAEIHSLTRIDAHFSGSDSGIVWLGRMVDGRRSELSAGNAEIDVSLEVREDSIAIKTNFYDEGSFNGAGQGNLVSNDEGLSLSVSNATLTIHEEGWRKLGELAANDTTIRVHSGEFTLKDFDWQIREGSYPTGGISGFVCELNMGPEEAPLYSGDLYIPEMQMVGGDMLETQGSVGLGDSLVFDLAAQYSEENQFIKIDFEDCGKSDLVAQTPQDFRTEIDELAFDRLSGNIRLYLRDEAYALDGTIQSTSTSGDSPVGLQVALEGAQGKIAGTTGTLSMTLGDGKMTGSGRMTEAGDYEADVTLESMPLRPFALLTAGARLPEEVSGALDGTVSMRQAAESVEVTVTPVIVLSKVMVEEKSQPDLTLKSEIVVDTEMRLARTDSFTISTDYDEVSLALSGAEYDLNTQKLTGDLAFGFDLGWVNRLADLGGISGTLKGSGTFSGVDQKWYLDYTATSDDIGYGNLLLPYGSEMTITGPLRVFEEDSEVNMGGTRITVDDGLEVMLHTARYEAGVLTGRADAKSDLGILVAMGNVEETSASVSGEATWAIDDDDREIAWVAEGSIESLELLENAGAVENTSFDAKGTYTDKLDGDGTIEVGVIHAAGATIFGTTGAIDFEDNKLVIKDANSTIFDGTLSSRVAVDLFGEGIPIRYDGDFTDVDLARLTEEVKPPSTTMTGIARGDLEANYSIEKGLLGFELDAESNKGFTINRSLVEEMMQMQTVLKGLGEKKAEKTMAKFLGAEPQRPFETARITVFLFEEVIEGVAELKSPKTKDYNGLNLTIQLSIDQPALVQSLKMLEESSETEFGIQ